MELDRCLGVLSRFINCLSGQKDTPSFRSSDSGQPELPPAEKPQSFRDQLAVSQLPISPVSVSIKMSCPKEDREQAKAPISDTRQYNFTQGVHSALADTVSSLSMEELKKEIESILRDPTFPGTFHSSKLECLPDLIQLSPAYVAMVEKAYLACRKDGISLPF